MCINVKEFFILVIYRHFSLFLNYCNALWGNERQKEGTVRGRAVITLTGLHDSEKSSLDSQSQVLYLMMEKEKHREE